MESVYRNDAVCLSPACEQFVWSLRYIDAPVRRRRDTNADGTPEETLYVTTDANFNVTALVDTSGSVQERYAYTPYGQPSVLSPAWGSQSWGTYENHHLYCGYYGDVDAAAMPRSLSAT